MIVETNILEYALAVIFLIMIKEKVYTVIFYFYLFKAIELNYNMHNKELLMVFEAFHTWHHYLEGSEWSIDIIIDYKNLEYFLITKILFCY